MAEPTPALEELQTRLTGLISLALDRAEQIIREGRPAERDKLIVALFAKMLPLLVGGEPDEIAQMSAQFVAILDELRVA